MPSTIQASANLRSAVPAGNLSEWYEPGQFLDPANNDTSLRVADLPDRRATSSFAHARPANALLHPLASKKTPKRMYKREVDALISAMPRAEQARYLSEHGGAINWQVRRTFCSIPKSLRYGDLYNELCGLAQEVFLEFVVRYRNPAEGRVIQCWWNYGKGRLLRSLMRCASSVELQLWLKRGHMRSKARTEWAKKNGRPPGEKERDSIHRAVDEKLVRGMVRRIDSKQQFGEAENSSDSCVFSIATAKLGNFFERLPPLQKYYFIHLAAMKESGRQIADNLKISHQAVSQQVIHLAMRFQQDMRCDGAGEPQAGKLFHSGRVFKPIPQDVAWEAIETVVSRERAILFRPGMNPSDFTASISALHLINMQPPLLRVA